MELIEVGGHVQPSDRSVHPMIAAAAVSPTEAVIQFQGRAMHAPMAQISTSMVELCCNDEGCCLIPNDRNAANDLKL